MRIPDGPGTIGGRYVPANPQIGQPASTVTDTAMNELSYEALNVIQAAGLTPSGADETQLLQAITRISAGSGAVRNLFVNGRFLLWQRGTTFPVTTSKVYTADRWYAQADSAGGNGVATVSRQNIAVGASDFPGGQTEFLSYSQTTGASLARPRVGQIVENILPLGGKDVSVTFWARASVEISAEVAVISDFGTGPGASSPVEQTTAQNIGTDWTEYTFSYTLPANTGATLGDDHGLRVEIRGPQSSPFILDLASCQVEVGLPTAIEPRPIYKELELAQRYYEKTYPIDVDPGTVTAEGQLSALGGAVAPVDRVFNLNTEFLVPKRTTPTITWYDPSQATPGQIGNWAESAQYGVTSVVGVSSERTGIPVLDSSPTASEPLLAHFVADAEIY